MLLRAALVGDVAHDAHEPGREAVPAADRADLDLAPALGAGGGQIAVRVTQRDALAAHQRREGARVGAAVVGVHEVPHGAAERSLDREARRDRPGVGEVRPAALGVGLEHAVGDALDDAAVALLALAQAALGVAEVGQVGVDDHRAEALAVGAGDRPAAREQPATTFGALDDDLDRADLLAAERAQQRRLVRAERAAVEVVQAEVLGPLERVQIVVDGRAVERVQAPVGVGDAHALAQLRRARPAGTCAALRASGAAPAPRRCRARRPRRA